MNVSQLIKMLSELPPKAPVLGLLFDDQDERDLYEPVIQVETQKIRKMSNGTYEPLKDVWGEYSGGKPKTVVFLTLDCLHYKVAKKIQNKSDKDKKAERIAVANSSTIIEDMFPDTKV